MDVSAFVKTGTPPDGGVDGPSPVGGVPLFQGGSSPPLRSGWTNRWRAYRKLPSLFRMVPSLTLRASPSPQHGGSICTQHTRMAIFLQRVIRSTLCLVLWWGFFGGRRIERRYLRFEQIQYGGHRHVAKISSGHAIGRPIHFMFGYRVGFSVTADLMALFSIRTNTRWRPPPSWIIWNDHTSATATYIAHSFLVLLIPA